MESALSLPATPLPADIPVYAAGTRAGTWHDPLPVQAANDCRVLIRCGDGTAVACWLSTAADGQPRLHFEDWSGLLHLADALRLRGRGAVLTFLAAGGGDDQPVD
jgi:hypothetical protein